MQLTLHATRRTPHGASRLVLAMSAWSVKTRRAPSRHRKDARVYGPTATAMHDNEYTHKVIRSKLLASRSGRALRYPKLILLRGPVPDSEKTDRIAAAD